MPGAARVIFVPHLRLGRALLVNKLVELGCHKLALPYPKELRRDLTLYSQGSIGWRELVWRVRELLGDYHRPWLYVEEPLVRGLRILREAAGGLSIVCYESLEELRRGLEGRYGLLALALRRRVGLSVSPEEVRRHLRGGDGALVKVLARVVELGYVAVVTDRGLASALADEVLEVLPGYVESPAERILKCPDERTFEEFVKYIFDYVLTSENADVAYFRWLADTYPESELARRAADLIRLARSAGPPRPGPRSDRNP